MKKTFIVAASLLVLTACQKNKETEVKSEETIIETPTDTVTVDTDTIAAVETDGVENAQLAGADEEVKNVKEKIEVKQPKELKVEYAAFGDKIIAQNALSKEEMLKKYKNLKPGDTINVKFKSTVQDVCQKKGCWMKLELPNGKDSFVRFKDYGFFVPLNAATHEAVVSGKAFINEISVAELKHYAKDGGKPQEEIDKITQPKVTYAFQADGVLISK
ncbi:DUF4920 domain-containing protein [Flavobacterium sp. MK4S-17]|uniref:DUF4920 domain-containing protein n=1 Tax=Flavobacterium sp. MK4S-17 TaxID=2543737 RepID=UPI001F4871A7|nr:DUF4920 domain-containing protein [Flavobacterium sp. MK4S-17]